MSEEEKFDELLRSRMSERDFPFNESSWEEAERLIERRENREKTARFLLIFFTGVVAGTLIMLPFILNTHSALPGTLAVHPVTGQNTVATTNREPVTNPSATSADNAITKEQKTAPSVAESDNRAGMQPSAFVKKDDTRTGTQATPARTFVAKEYKQKQRTSVSSAGIDKHSVKSSEKSNRVASVSSDNQLPVTRENNQQSSPVVVSGKENGNKEPGNTPVTANLSSPQADSISVAIHNTPQPGSYDTPKKSNTATADNSVQQSSRDTSVKNAAPNATANNNTSMPKKGENGIRYPDTSYTPDDDLSSLVFHNIFSVYAGGTYSLGWQGPDITKSVTQGKGLTPWAGFNFTHYFSPDISASIGIGYAELSGLNNEYSNSFTQYGFGLNEKITTVTPQLVYYMAFPFKVQYDIDSKDLLGIGCNYLLMMTTYGTLTTSQQIDFSATTTSEKQNGYTQGFSNSDWQLTFSYTRMFMRRLGVSAEYFHDFNYIENNTIPSLIQNTKNSGFRLVISYQLLR